jgi:hypothetical protein
MIQQNSLDWPGGRVWQRRFLLAGVVGVAVCIAAAVLDVEQFLRSYLFAYFAWLGIALGSLALWMLHNLTGGAWGLVLRRIWEAASRTLTSMVVLFAPIALGAYILFPWASATSSELGGKVDYLNVPGFLGRAALYFVIWLGTAYLLNRWSRQHDESGDRALVARALQLSGPGLVFCGLAVTFAAIDWVMSLEPEWYSTVFGALVAMGHLVAALAFAVMMATVVFRSTSAPPGLDLKSCWNDLGNLLLAFVMMWTYLAFSQFLLIWSGNLPEEITWYLHRTEGGWEWIGLSLAIGYFALPFCLLLMPDMKRDPDRLRLVALLIVVMSAINNYWRIAPAFSPGWIRLHWMDLAAFLAVGCLWLASFMHQLVRRPILPVHDIEVDAEISHEAAGRPL